MGFPAIHFAGLTGKLEAGSRLQAPRLVWTNGHLT